MSALAFIVGVVLPPITFVVFVAATLSRLWTWKKMAQPGMTLFPTSPSGTAAGVVKETLFFPSLFRGDRFLWLMSWLFHAMLALVFIGHLRVVMDFPALWALLHIDADTMSAVVGGAAGVTILVMIVLLIGRRFAVDRVREISAPADYFALFLLLAIVLTGNAMRFLDHFDLAVSREYFASLVMLQTPLVPESGWFLAHLLLGQMLLLYIPFSKIMHFGGVFFTQAAIKRS
ncbi:MAG: respiratory nitrate reductase subunit gamma [Candidatus Sulfomarinibacteraceae bacterium]